MSENAQVTGPGALRADCSRCVGLCCVVPAFSASSEFAIDKPAGHACPNLRSDSRCAIHADLRRRGFPGCTVYDCFGAGQQVTQATFDGADWRGDAATAAGMASAFPVVRALYELMWYLTDLLARDAAAALHPAGEAALAEHRRLAASPAPALAALDLGAVRDAVDPLLRHASALVRAEAGQGRDAERAEARRGGGLVGARLRGADLRGADLRGALLIGSDLRGADLRGADLVGADLRGCDLRAADVSTSLYLTQSQVNAARGDAMTRLAGTLDRPTHWTAPRPSGSGERLGHGSKHSGIESTVPRGDSVRPLGS